MRRSRPLLSARGSRRTAVRSTSLVQLREWKRRLSLLLDYTRAIAVKKDLSSLLPLLVDAACRILEAERATVFLLDRTTHELWSRVASGGNVIRVPMDRGIVGDAILKDRVVNIPDAYRDRRFNPAVDRATGFRTRSVLAAPLSNAQGLTLGALQILNKRRGRFTREDERMLVLFAEQASTAIENAQLLEEIQAATKDTIFRLAAAAEFKDHDTRNHLERVSRYSGLLAEEVGMPDPWCRNILMASPMHDIGKLGVPDAILRKPGRLDEAEWKEMRKHPGFGAEILARSTNEVMQMAERVARSHHEKWDGSGYPDGLAGESIPLEARIVALADVFDALTSRRVYKPAFDLADSVKIISEGNGKHFDPRLVEAFHRCFPKMVQVMESFADQPRATPAPSAPSAPAVAAG